MPSDRVFIQEGFYSSYLAVQYSSTLGATNCKMFSIIVLSCLLSYANSFDLNRNCGHSSAFTELSHLRNEDKCYSMEQASKLLKTVQDQGGSDCRTNIINYLRYHYGNDTTPWEKCACTGTNMLKDWPAMSGGDNHRNCHHYDRHYRELYDQFFHYQSGSYTPACRTHHSLWYDLSLTNVNYQCQYQLITHVEYAFRQDPCTCTASFANLHPTTTAHCTAYDSYNVLESLLDGNICMSANKVWRHLAALHREDDHCRERIVARLAGRYRNIDSVSNQGCSCSGSIHSHGISINYGQKDDCRNTFHQYSELYDKTYTHAQCADHKYVWRLLNNSGHLHNGYNCQLDFIERSIYIYPEDSKDDCQCQHVHPHPVTDAPTHPPTTVAITTPTTQPPYTVQDYGCSKIGLVTDIALDVVTTHPKASRCNDQNNHTTDAPLLIHCNVTHDVTLWHSGEKVMTACQNHSPIPAYTPVSSFTSDNFDPTNAKTGVFLTCEANGFKMIEQHCNSPPVIRHLTIGGTDDPLTYFRIV